MRTLWGVSVAVGSLLALAGCTRAAGPAQTVSYLRAHPKVLQSVWAGCANDPGGLGRTAQCLNARRAELLNQIGSFRSLPPMHFPPVPARARPAAPRP